MLGIEDAPLRNPYYHKTTDTLATLEMEFLASVTRGSLALVADLAQPFRVPAVPTGVSARTQIAASLFATRKTVILNWNAGGGDVAGYHVYRSPTPHGAAQRLDAVLIRQTYFLDRYLAPDAAYYYTVTAVDLQGRESNSSIEVGVR
jgi:hypothetical protein